MRPSRQRRAGDQGKGFAVVASEVRQLAEQSSLATGQITNLINDIQAETSVTVRTMESNLLAVEEQVTIINKGGSALKEIVEKVVETEEGVEQMKVAFTHVNDNSLDVQQAIQDISRIIEDAAARLQKRLPQPQKSNMRLLPKLHKAQMSYHQLLINYKMK